MHFSLASISINLFHQTLTSMTTKRLDEMRSFEILRIYALFYNINVNFVFNCFWELACKIQANGTDSYYITLQSSGLSVTSNTIKSLILFELYVKENISSTGPVKTHTH